MAKFSNPSKLSSDEQERLLINFCRALSQIKDEAEAAQLIKDLLSRQEAEMLAKRLRAAELLMDGKRYSEISLELKIGSNTIARVHEWLKLSGEGYRLILDRMEKTKEPRNIKARDYFDSSSWKSVKKKYPMYFWPQLLLEDIMKTAKKKDKEKMRAILSKMDKKSELFKRIGGILDKSIK